MDFNETFVVIVNSIKLSNLNRVLIENGIPLLSFYFIECRYPCFEDVMAFIANGCDLTAQDEYGSTPFHWLVVCNSARQIKKLTLLEES